jgi:hypothetical protein
MMMITLDNLAHRYQCLPSEALARSNTFDLKVLHLSSAWQHHQQEQAEAEANPGAPRKPKRKKHTANELQAMLDAVRDKK